MKFQYDFDYNNRSFVFMIDFDPYKFTEESYSAGAYEFDIYRCIFRRGKYIAYKIDKYMLLQKKLDVWIDLMNCIEQLCIDHAEEHFNDDYYEELLHGI